MIILEFRIKFYYIFYKNKKLLGQKRREHYKKIIIYCSNLNTN